MIYVKKLQLSLKPYKGKISIVLLHEFELQHPQYEVIYSNKPLFMHQKLKKN